MRYWAFIRNSSQSDQSRAFSTVTQDQEFCLTCNLGWEVKYHNHSLFKWFLGKSIYFFLKKNNIKYPFLAIFAQIWTKMNFMWKPVLLLHYKLSNKGFYEMTVISLLVGRQRRNWSKKKNKPLPYLNPWLTRGKLRGFTG